MNRIKRHAVKWSGITYYKTGRGRTREDGMEKMGGWDGVGEDGMECSGMEWSEPE